jgi:glucose/mannose transport system substrate-binding protein
VAINRIVGGNPPTAAQFNTSKQFLDIVEQGMLTPMDEVALRDGWDKFLPEIVLNAVRVKGHYYAVPVNIHMPTWLWYSKAASRPAGVAAEPKSMDELFAALDKLKAAGLVGLAHGGQSWQDNIVFTAVLANVGGRELYLKVLRDRDAAVIQSDAFRQVLLSFKRLQGYVDKGSPGRNWNDATALLINGKAGFQFMGDWAKGEFSLAGKVPGATTAAFPALARRRPTSSRATCSYSPRPSRPTPEGAATAGQRDHAPGHAGRLQPAQGLHSDPHRCGHIQARCLRAAGRGHHEGQVAPPGQRRDLPDARSERCAWPTSSPPTGTATSRSRRCSATSPRHSSAEP